MTALTMGDAAARDGTHRIGSRQPQADPVAELEATPGRLRDEARQLLGVAGQSQYDPVRHVLTATGLSLYPLVAISLLGAVMSMTLVLGPLLRSDIARTDGGAWLGIFGPIRVVIFLLGVVAALGARRWRRDRSHDAVLAGIGMAAALLVASVSNSHGVVTVLALVMAASALAWTVHLPLLMDSYRAELRVRAATAYGAGLMLGAAVAAALVALTETGLGLTWRSVLLIAAQLALGTCLLAHRLADPGEERWDGEPIAGLVQRSEGGLGDQRASLAAEEVVLTTSEEFARVSAVQLTKPLLLTAGLFGVAMVPLLDYLLILFRDHWDVHRGGRLLIFAVLCMAGIAGLAWFGRRGEVLFRLSLSSFLSFVARLAIGVSVTLTLATAAPIVPGIAMLALAFVGLAAFVPSTAVVLLTVVRPRLRAHAAGMLGIAAVVGTEIGRQLMSTIGGRFGVEWGIRAVALAALGAAHSLRRASRRADAELDRMCDELVEEETLRTWVSQGRHLPLLGCRHIDFSYGQMQVLFGVDFTVDDGEMVALLGTNGAGKSTLLRVISGLGLPSRGTVHYRGVDITYLDTNRRVRFGVSQVPGGRAVFGPMTVAENLRAYGFSQGRRGTTHVERGVDEVFEAFPRLAERRNQLASTMSGGEQQMLALAKAYILKPRLLLIDELSLGLAPIVVGELLEMVRRVNAAGTAVVLVEQSVNIALSVVHHAYFMEKGQVRFDGEAAELLARPDLLRSVFLEGAATAAKEAVL